MRWSSANREYIYIIWFVEVQPYKGVQNLWKFIKTVRHFQPYSKAVQNLVNLLHTLDLGLRKIKRKTEVRGIHAGFRLSLN